MPGPKKRIEPDADERSTENMQPDLQKHCNTTRGSKRGEEGRKERERDAARILCPRREKTRREVRAGLFFPVKPCGFAY